MAKRLIESYEHCGPEGAEIPFDNILYRVTGSDPSVTDYILEQPTKCPNCRPEIFEKRLVEPVQRKQLSEIPDPPVLMTMMRTKTGQKWPLVGPEHRNVVPVKTDSYPLCQGRAICNFLTVLTIAKEC
jgi:hypothetical protein